MKVTKPLGGISAYRLQTGANGVAVFSQLGGVTGTYTFAVANVTAAGRTYDPAQNVETSDSLTIS